MASSLGRLFERARRMLGRDSCESHPTAPDLAAQKEKLNRRIRELTSANESGELECRRLTEKLDEVISQVKELQGKMAKNESRLAKLKSERSAAVESARKHFVIAPAVAVEELSC